MADVNLRIIVEDLASEAVDQISQGFREFESSISPLENRLASLSQVEGAAGEKAAGLRDILVEQRANLQAGKIGMDEYASSVEFVRSEMAKLGGTVTETASELERINEDIRTATADFNAGLISTDDYGTALDSARKEAIQFRQANNLSGKDLRSFQSILNSTDAQATKATKGMGKLKNTISSIAVAATGTKGPIGNLAKGMLAFSLGPGGVAGLIVGGVAAIALGYRLLTKESREAAEKQKALHEELEKTATSILPRIQVVEQQRTDLMRESNDLVAKQARLEQERARVLADGAEAGVAYGSVESEVLRIERELEDVQKKRVNVSVSLNRLRRIETETIDKQVESQRSALQFQRFLIGASAFEAIEIRVRAFEHELRLRQDMREEDIQSLVRQRRALELSQRRQQFVDLEARALLEIRSIGKTTVAIYEAELRARRDLTEAEIQRLVTLKQQASFREVEQEALLSLNEAILNENALQREQLRLLGLTAAEIERILELRQRERAARAEQELAGRIGRADAPVDPEELGIAPPTDEWERFSQIIRGSLVPGIADAQVEIENFGIALADVALQGLELQDAFYAAFIAVREGGKNVGKAFGEAIQKSVAQAAAAKGAFYLQEGVAALAVGILGDPRGFVAAGRFFAAAAGMFALAHISAGGTSLGGGGGGGGGGSSGRDGGSDRNDMLPPLTLVIRSPMTRVSPEFVDLVAQAIGEATSRDVILEVGE